MMFDLKLRAQIRKGQGEHAEFEDKWIRDKYNVEPGCILDIVDNKPFISAYHNCGEVPNYLCKRDDGSMVYIMASDMKILEQEFNPEDFQGGQLIGEESKWEVFRREAAKDILCSSLGRTTPIKYSDGTEILSYGEVADYAIGAADTLIEKLKGIKED